MIRIFLIAILMLICTAGNSQDDWVRRRERNDVIIHTREKEGSSLKEYRVSSTINSSLQEAYDFLTDLEYRPAWVVNCAGLQILDTLEGNLVIYHTAYDVPWPVSDRDLVVGTISTIDTTAGTAHLLTTLSDREYPLEKGIIRMTRYREEVYLEEVQPGLIMSTAEGFADPGGNIPAWIVNMFLVDGIYDSVIRTQKEIRERQGWETGTD